MNRQESLCVGVIMFLGICTQALHENLSVTLAKNEPPAFCGDSGVVTRMALNAVQAVLDHDKMFQDMPADRQQVILKAAGVYLSKQAQAAVQLPL